MQVSGLFPVVAPFLFILFYPFFNALFGNFITFLAQSGHLIFSQTAVAKSL
jgi:hypothetical protein